MNQPFPLSVPKKSRSEFEKNYSYATKHSKHNRFFLLAGDQKIEHLNDDFYGDGIAKESASPEHLFKIAAQGTVGGLATQLGLIARYGSDYSSVPYIIKLNGKTNLIPTDQEDPISRAFTTVEQVIAFKKESNLNIIGIGYTIYPGSKYESIMFTEAAHSIYQAHLHGLITVLWSYPRGRFVTSEQDASMIAGAAGIGACLGADFIKVNPPNTSNSAQLLQQATQAAGKSGIICSGGKTQNPDDFLIRLHDQIHTGGTRGAAVGRNLHQKPLTQAIALSKAIAALIYDNCSIEYAQNLLRK